MHLFITPAEATATATSAKTSTVPSQIINLDGNTTLISVSNIPQGLHSISINESKYLVFIDDTQRHIPLNSECQLVSILSVVSCLYPQQSDWKSLTNLITLETFRSVTCLADEKYALLVDDDHASFQFIMIPSKHSVYRLPTDFASVDNLSMNNLSIKDICSKDSLCHSSENSQKNNKQSSNNTTNSETKSHYISTQLTKAHLINSDLLLVDLQKLLQELQLSFILFSFFQSEEGYTHYKSALDYVTHLVLNPRTIKSVYLKLVDILSVQIKCFPRDFFRDPLSKGSFLEECLKSLYSIVCEDVHGLEKKENIEKYLQEKGSVEEEGVANIRTLQLGVEKFRDVVFELFDWDMRCELDDELPTVVYE